MDKFWLGAGAIAGLALIGFIVWTTRKIKRLENLTLEALETVKDDNIKTGIKALSDAELDALLDKDIGPKPKS